MRPNVFNQLLLLSLSINIHKYVKQNSKNIRVSYLHFRIKWLISIITYTRMNE